MLRVALGILVAGCGLAASSVENFDSDPGWQGINNRPAPGSGVHKVQNFGYAHSSFAGGNAGEIGGTIARSFTPANYARSIPERTLDDPLSASGTFAVTRSNGGGMLVGWFNENSRGWRTPNSLAFRIDGESGKYRLLYEYGTQTWKTGGGGAFEGIYQTTSTPMYLADGTVHQWKLDYDPNGADGQGLIAFQVDDQRFSTALDPGHRAEGAVFNRFGIFNQMIAGSDIDVYLDDLTVDGQREDFAKDPGWIEVGNRSEFTDTLVRPLHNFGYSATNHAGGAPGEIGGVVWRIESMNPEQSACYASPVNNLNFNKPFRASGKVAMTAASADSGLLIGWFNEKTIYGAPPLNFAGVLIEGPSRAGHYFRPVWGSSDEEKRVADVGPTIRPDSRSHVWSIEYNPETSIITSSLDGVEASLEISPAARKGNAALNRFGILTWMRGGHFVEVYFDDVEFTRD